MVAMIGELFLPLMFVGLISPMAAVIVAILLFGRHRARVEAERRVPVIGYVLATIVCGVIGGFFGLISGLALACPVMGNLCGLFPVFVAAPISFALGVLLVGIAVSWIRPAPRPDDYNSN
jgi:uncharacterized membrane protein YfcA